MAFGGGINKWSLTAPAPAKRMVPARTPAEMLAEDPSYDPMLDAMMKQKGVLYRPVSELVRYLGDTSGRTLASVRADVDRLAAQFTRAAAAHEERQKVLMGLLGGRS